MGGDGGCHPNGRKFMRPGMLQDADARAKKARDAQADKREQTLIRTRTCALTNEPLVMDSPVVADELGNLFSKQHLIEALMDKKIPTEFDHIRGLKDVTSCRFTANPSWVEATDNGSKAEAAGGFYWSTDVVSPYACPVSQVEMNGKNPFVVVRTTGWVLSERALKQVGLANLQEEYGPFAEEDCIKLAPNEEERAALVTRMNEARAAKAAKKAAKKDKKRKLAAAEASSSSSSSSSNSGSGATAAEDASAVVAGPVFDAKAAAEAAAEGGEAVPKKKKKSTGTDGVGKRAVSGLASSSASSMASSILDEVAKVREAQSDLYKGLFKGTGERKMQKADDVFIRDTGQRYTLG